MTIDYNQGRIAEQYKEAKRQPWRDRLETYSFVKLIGDLRGKRVADIACGSGHFTRRLKRAGAAQVVGMDVSERMVEMARESEASEPLGIEYRVVDVKEIVPQEDFDLAVSAWLLVYARSRAELAEMCNGLACWLRPGGRFVTLTTNPGVYHFDSPADYHKYGFDMELDDHVYEGAPILWHINLTDSVLDIDNYYMPIAAYEEALVSAGFKDFKVHNPRLSPNPDGIDDTGYWQHFVDHPIFIMLECIKA